MKIAIAGSGVRRVIDTFVAYGLPEPEFEATQDGMAVTVFNAFKRATDGGVNGGVSGGVSGGVNGGVNGGVSSDPAELLRLIQSRPGLNTTELVAQTNKPQRTIECWLKQLKAQGLVEFKGPTKTGGYHAIKENGASLPKGEIPS